MPYKSWGEGEPSFSFTNAGSATLLILFRLIYTLQPDNKPELSSNQAWLNSEDFFPTGEPVLISCSKCDLVHFVSPPPRLPIFNVGNSFSVAIISINVVVVVVKLIFKNQFQQLKLIFLLRSLHPGLSQSGRFSISINITESSGICINVLLTSWQASGIYSWDLRSKGWGEGCGLPYTSCRLDCKKLTGKASGFFSHNGKCEVKYPLLQSRCTNLTCVCVCMCVCVRAYKVLATCLLVQSMLKCLQLKSNFLIIF